MKRWLILIVVVVAIVAVVGGVKFKQIQALFAGFKAQGIPMQTVSSVKAAHAEWRGKLSAVGSVRAERGADLSAEVAGIVEAIEFKSGQEVKAGQLLARLRGQDDTAKLAGFRASARLAELTNKRDQLQLEAEAISKAQLENGEASLSSARAQVAEQEALIAKKSIRAPFAGQLGIRAVDLGQYLNPGDKIVTLQQLDQVLVDFYLPQQDLGEVAVGQKVGAVTDAFPSRTFAGDIVAIDPKVDTDTRNVRVRARLDNPDHKLLPGMYASVTIEVGEPKAYLTLPQNAVTYNPYGETVFVLIPWKQYKTEQDAKKQAEGVPPEPATKAQPGTPELPDDQLVAKQVFVTAGPTRGDQVAVLNGVAPGDEVVTSGTIKLKNGTAVTVNNSVQPSNDQAPKPVDQ